MAVNSGTWQIGETIRRLRRERVPRMSLADLAGDELSISLVSKIERGLTRPSMRTLELLAHRLGTTPAMLVSAPMDSDDAMTLEADLSLALDDAEAALAALHDQPTSGHAGLVRAAALLALDRDDDAAATAEAILLDDRSGIEHLARATLILATIHERRGSDAPAQRLFSRAMDLNTTVGDPDITAEALRRLAAIAIRGGALETARNLHAQATREANRAANPRRRAQRLRAEAMRRLHGGDAGGASRELRAAVEIARFGRAVQARGDIATMGAELAPAIDDPGAVTAFEQARSAIRQRAPRPRNET